MCIVHNVQKRCRLCLSDNGENLSIFDPQFCEGIPLSLKIMVCVSLTVSTLKYSFHIKYVHLISLNLLLRGHAENIFFSGDP
jgi:hypothetical protein